MSEKPRNPEKIVENISQHPIYTFFCQKVIPLAFDESLSYLETIYAFQYFLNNTVLPTVNNNADAVTELQGLYIELKEYTDNYLENELKNEVDIKLDKMAQDGTLENILQKYINKSLIRVYKNIDDLKSQDLSDGMVAKIIGNSEINDGGESLYYITENQPQNQYILLNNGNFAQLLSNSKDIIFSSKLGMNNTDNNSNNYDLLINAMNDERYKTIIIDSYYDIKYHTIADKEIKKDIKIIGLENAGFNFKNINANIDIFTLGTNSLNIEIENLNFRNDSDYIITILANSEEKKNNFYMDLLKIDNNIFNGNFRFSLNINNDIGVADNNYKIKEFIISSNMINDSDYSFIYLGNTPYDKLIFCDNIIHNFDGIILYDYLVEENGEREDCRILKKYCEIYNNTISNDINYWHSDTHHTSYYIAFYIENYYVDYYNNIVENMKAITDISLYDAYFNSVNVESYNNIWKNNISFNSAGSNSLIKAKAPDGSNRIYRNNSYIFTEEFYGFCKLQKPSITEDSISLKIFNSENQCLWTIKDNFINLYVLRSLERNLTIDDLIFSNNNIIINKYTHNAVFLPTRQNKNTIIENNNITIKNGEFTLAGGTTEGGNIIVKNNIFDIYSRYLLNSVTLNDFICVNNLIKNRYNTNNERLINYATINNCIIENNTLNCERAIENYLYLKENIQINNIKLIQKNLSTTNFIYLNNVVLADNERKDYIIETEIFNFTNNSLLKNYAYFALVNENGSIYIKFLDNSNEEKSIDIFSEDSTNYYIKTTETNIQFRFNAGERPSLRFIPKNTSGKAIINLSINNI